MSKNLLVSDSEYRFQTVKLIIFTFKYIHHTAGRQIKMNVGEKVHYPAEETGNGDTQVKYKSFKCVFMYRVPLFSYMAIHTAEYVQCDCCTATCSVIRVVLSESEFLHLSRKL